MDQAGFATFLGDRRNAGVRLQVGRRLPAGAVGVRVSRVPLSLYTALAARVISRRNKSHTAVATQNESVAAAICQAEKVWAAAIVLRNNSSVSPRPWESLRTMPRIGVCRTVMGTWKVVRKQNAAIQRSKLARPPNARSIRWIMMAPPKFSR